jgi:hypothetical protein
MRIIWLVFILLSTPAPGQEKPEEEPSSPNKQAANENSSPTDENPLPDSTGNSATTKTVVIEESVTDADLGEDPNNGPPPSNNENHKNNESVWVGFKTFFTDLKAQWFMAVAAIILCGVTIGQLVVGWVGIRLVGRTLKSNLWLIKEARKTNKAAATSAQASIDAAIAAQRSAKASEDMIGQSRAWVTGDGFEFRYVFNKEIVTDDGNLKKPTNLKIDLKAKNSGETPAIDIVTSFAARRESSLAINDKDIPPPPDLIFQGIKNFGLIGPGGTINIPLNFPLEILESIINQKYRYIIFVKLTYKTIFKDRAETCLCYDFRLGFGKRFFDLQASDWEPVPIGEKCSIT